MKRRGSGRSRCSPPSKNIGRTTALSTSVTTKYEDMTDPSPLTIELGVSSSKSDDPWENFIGSPPIIYTSALTWCRCPQLGGHCWRRKTATMTQVATLRMMAWSNRQAVIIKGGYSMSVLLTWLLKRILQSYHLKSSHCPLYQFRPSRCLVAEACEDTEKS